MRLFLLFLPLVLGQAADMQCPDSTLTTYLLKLIDTLYTNGLTYYESLLAALSESDEGYELLQSWYTDDRMTMFVPTDSAFQKANLGPTFDTLSPKLLADMVRLHTVNGEWGYDSLTPSPSKGFGDTQLGLKEWLNETVESDAKAPLVMQRGENGAIDLRLVDSNATTWGWVINGVDEIWNINIIPIDTVLPFPPKLSVALDSPTSSKSPKGFQEFKTALNGAGGPSQLEHLTKGGFTIFVPIDQAFTPDVKAVLASDNGVRVLGNHYATNYSLFSRIWVDNGPYTLPIISGSTVKVEQTQTGATVTLADQTVRILRSDIVLENGVMHIIEKVLIDPDSTLVSSSTRKSTETGAGTKSPQDGVAAAVQSSGAVRLSVKYGVNGIIFLLLSVALVV